MQVFSRVTVYGEYLMHEDCKGLIIKSPLYLSTQKLNNSTINYKPNLDLVTKSIAKYYHKDIELNEIYGTTPFGYGFASSTMITYLRLSEVLPKERLTKIANQIDEEVHGFEPSGLDIHSCLASGSGFFSRKNGWENIDITIKNYMLITFLKEKKNNLAKIQQKIEDRKERLIQVANKLTDEILLEGILNYNLLYEYSTELLVTDVYSEIVSKFVEKMLSMNLSSKGIGGLYDKAIIVFYRTEDDVLKIEKEAKKMNGKILKK